jgi:hypothetical protein
MQLNLPIIDALANSQNILIAGAGGGQDILVALPLYFTLRGLGKQVHLASYSFAELSIAPFLLETEVLIDELLIGVRGKLERPFPYFMEGYLAQWFAEIRGETVSIWLFSKVGGALLAQAYQRLQVHLGFDALILVDGGVDSLMRGDELGAGTLMEDSVSLAAASMLDVPVKILACLGFGTEVEESVCHYNALENMAGLIREGAFYGACALTQQMEAFRLYEQAARYIWEQPSVGRSHISTRIIPAVNGEFGNFHMYPEDQRLPILVSPLMSLYWFFNAEIVARRSLLVETLKLTETFDDVRALMFRHADGIRNFRPRRSLPY